MRLPSPASSTLGHLWNSPYITSLNRRCGLRRFCPTRHDPQFDGVFLAEAAIENYDSRRVYASPGHQIVSRTYAKAISLTHAAGSCAIDDDISRCRRIVLELNCQVVQTSLLIVIRTTVANIKLSRRILTWWRRRHEG